MSRKKKTEEPSINVEMSFYEMDVVLTAILTRMQHLENIGAPVHPSVGAQLACLDAMHDRINTHMNDLEAREALPAVMAGIEDMLRGGSDE